MTYLVSHNFTKRIWTKTIFIGKYYFLILRKLNKCSKISQQTYLNHCTKTKFGLWFFFLITELNEVRIRKQKIKIEVCAWIFSNYIILLYRLFLVIPSIMLFFSFQHYLFRFLYFISTAVGKRKLEYMESKWTHWY